MKISILTVLVSVSSILASQIREAVDSPLENRNYVASGQLQGENNLNHYRGYRNRGNHRGCSCRARSRHRRRVPRNVGKVGSGNIRFNCKGGNKNPSNQIFKKILEAFEHLKLHAEQPENGVKACIKSNTGEEWCGLCFAHDDSNPRHSTRVWNRLTKPQKASICINMLKHVKRSGFRVNQCVNTYTISRIGDIGTHSYVTNQPPKEQEFCD
ncbi:hypothetical protein BB558_002601 [Smittium angustum]|uniref:Uncharacterized protein n=1 Tax=Smittium angustum TaxID=133377 RepID=A0A2U1J871_SMIAN|nr:hypothetical protein BB558_002601 [Smittium angustum]